MFLKIICLVTIVFFVLRLLYFILRSVYYGQLKKEFKRKYNLDCFPSKVKIHKNRSNENKNYYTLKFPHWIYANKDGSKDKRYKNNAVRYPGCDLYVDQFHIVINNPILMVQLVNILRKRKVQIEENKYEKKKINGILKAKERDNRLTSVKNIIDEFKDNPYGFESYCAQLYRSIGINVEQTSNSNDGGYDLILYYQNGEKGLVECKCYSSSKIGRPLIQKLVGANQVVGAKYLIFITTSDYSMEARKYAEEAGVKLVDGNELISMINGVLKSTQKEITLHKNEWFLCKKDFKQYIPEDIYSKL